MMFGVGQHPLTSGLRTWVYAPLPLLFFQMEKYSKHLEVLVAERTQELIAEQKKTDSLLYSESHFNYAEGRW